MTQQYLVGALSSMLGELEAAAAGAPAGGQISLLRHHAEALPPEALGPDVESAVRLANRVCGEALATGTAATFIREVKICAELREWGTCAGFLPDAPTDDQC